MKAQIGSSLTVMALVAAGPSMAQDDLPRWAAGCQTMATTYLGRADADPRKQVDQAAAFWRAALERAEPDAGKRAELAAGTRAALDADLAGKSAAEQKTIFDAGLDVCARLRPFAERVEKTAEVKP